MVALARFAATDPVHEMLRALHQDGGLIVEGLAVPEQLARWRRELAPYIDATAVGADEFGGARTTRTGALIARSTVAREMAVHPVMLQLAEGLLGPSCRRFQLNTTQAIRLMPGQPAQPFHRDQTIWTEWVKDLDVELSFITAITDFTEENGATLAVPGSSGWPHDRKVRADEVCPAVMPAGSAIVYSGRMIHAGGANRSNSDRVGVHISYILGWLRQEENQYLCCPPEHARGLSTELTRLMGYDMGGYALGYYSPPAGPGEDVEIVNPEYAVTGQGVASYMGTASDAAGILEEMKTRQAAAIGTALTDADRTTSGPQKSRA